MATGDYDWHDLTFTFEQKLTAIQMTRFRNDLKSLFTQSSGAPAWGHIDTGQYTGNGVTSRYISGVGFEPDVVLVGRASSTGVYMRTQNMDATYSKRLASGTYTSIIEAINADGFTVDVGANASANVYWYFCANWATTHSGQSSDFGHPYHDLDADFFWGDTMPASNMQAFYDNMTATYNQESGTPPSSIIEKGTYTGDGTSGQIITLGFRPSYFETWRRPTGAGDIVHPIMWWSSMAAGWSAFVGGIFRTGGSAVSCTGVFSDGITVSASGGSYDPNINGQTYDYITMRDGTN